MITVSTSKAKTSSYHHGDLRDALIAAALAILEEGGDPAALSLREVARRAGVSAMAPYRHFADKEALLAAVAAIGFDRLAEALRDGDRFESSTDALIGQGVAYVAFACANPSLFRLMFGRVLAAQCGDRAPTGAPAYTVMAQRVAAINGSGDAEDWAMCCWATAHGIASLAVDGQLAYTGETPTVLADRVLRLLGITRKTGLG
jgi:AcrR family transcriptional regulator